MEPWMYGPPQHGGLYESPFHREMSHNPVAQQAAAGLGFYASAGVLDPKAPVIDVPLASKALKVGYWVAYATQLPYAVIGGVGIGVTLDPAHKFEGWGVDEVWEWGPQHPYSSWSYSGQPGSV